MVEGVCIFDGGWSSGRDWLLLMSFGIGYYLGLN